MFHLSIEDKIILSLSRLKLSECAINNIKGLIFRHGDNIDYTELYNQASINGVASFVYINMKRFNLLPKNIINKFENNYFFVAAKNTFQAKEIIRIIHMLKDFGINAIPLKGAFAAEKIFRNVGLYPSDDIDILIPPESLTAADTVLCNNQYTKCETIRESDLLKNHYHLIYQKEDMICEVHWNLVKRYFSIPHHFWWNDTVEVGFEGKEITSLSVEKYIIYTIFRLFDHRFSPLKFFILTSELINRYQAEIDWSKILRYSKKYDMEKLVFFVLRFLNEFFETAVPDKMKNKKIYSYGLLKNLIFSGMFGEIKKPHVRMLIYVLLLIDPMKIVNIILGRIFPHSGEIRLRYGLLKGSNKVYLYYLLNPFLLFMKKKDYNKSTQPANYSSNYGPKSRI